MSHVILQQKQPVFIIGSIVSFLCTWYFIKLFNVLDNIIYATHGKIVISYWYMLIAGLLGMIFFILCVVLMLAFITVTKNVKLQVKK